MSKRLAFDTIRDAYAHIHWRGSDAAEPTIAAGLEEYDWHAQHYPYTLPQSALTFDNVDDMRRRVSASGSHYFDADAVRFFRGRTDPVMFGGRFWVESRKYVNAYAGEESPREYAVAWVSEYVNPDTGARSLSIERLGWLPTLIMARAFARALCETVDREAPAA